MSYLQRPATDVETMSNRCSHIAALHRREPRHLDCVECGQTWPCDTYRIATGTFREYP